MKTDNANIYEIMWIEKDMNCAAVSCQHKVLLKFLSKTDVESVLLPLQWNELQKDMSNVICVLLLIFLGLYFIPNSNSSIPFDTVPVSDIKNDDYDASTDEDSKSPEVTIEAGMNENLNNLKISVVCILKSSSRQK